MSYKIYTDGASRGNPGISSWAFVVYDQDSNELGSKSGVAELSTNNAMELMAITNALAHVCKNVDKYRAVGGVTIFTDSAFCISVVSQWMDGWQKNGWTKKTPGAIKNLEIIQQLHKLWHTVGQAIGNLQISKVAGHSGCMGNERADSLCNKAIDNFVK